LNFHVCPLIVGLILLLLSKKLAILLQAASACFYSNDLQMARKYFPLRQFLPGKLKKCAAHLFCFTNMLALPVNIF
jgi:hypothetical protein